jgi:hypothetical protein
MRSYLKYQAETELIPILKRLSETSDGNQPALENVGGLLQLEVMATAIEVSPTTSIWRGSYPVRGGTCPGSF